LTIDIIVLPEKYYPARTKIFLMMILMRITEVS
jgi:hypothetical protein